MATVDADTRSEIEKRLDLYEDARNTAATRISGLFREAMDDLGEIEKKFLSEMDDEHNPNPFLNFLASIEAGENLTEDDVRDIMSQAIPKSFTSNEESLRSLL